MTYCLAVNHPSFGLATCRLFRLTNMSDDTGSELQINVKGVLTSGAINVHGDTSLTKYGAVQDPASSSSKSR